MFDVGASWDDSKYGDMMTGSTDIPFSNRIVVSLNNVSLDDPSGIWYPLEFCAPWTMRPLANSSLTDGSCYIRTDRTYVVS